MKESYGNLLDVTSGLIAHQTNCMDRIGAGVAQAIIEKYPVVKSEYHAFCRIYKTPEARFGRIQAIPVSADLTIFNSFSQLNYGNAKRLGRVFTDMNILTRNIGAILKSSPDKILYLPGYIGCGLAGGDWCQLKHNLSKLPGSERIEIIYLKR